MQEQLGLRPLDSTPKPKRFPHGRRDLVGEPVDEPRRLGMRVEVAGHRAVPGVEEPLVVDLVEAEARGLEGPQEPALAAGISNRKALRAGNSNPGSSRPSMSRVLPTRKPRPAPALLSLPRK